MIENLFALRYVKIDTVGWDRKKPEIKSLLDPEEFHRQDLAVFDTDRHHNRNRYLDDFCTIFSDELTKFAFEMGFTQLKMGAIWAVRYGRGDYHSVHNHRSTGYSGILYLDYNPEVHTPSIHVAPWNDPVNDATQLSMPPVSEGSMVFVPSCVLHYTRPNQSDELRQIMAFDMEVR
jgi:hypothetical protein